MPEHQGNSSLFAIFALSIYSLFLAPFTIYHFCNAEEGGAVQSYQVRSSPSCTEGFSDPNSCNSYTAGHRSFEALCASQGKKKQTASSKLAKKIFTRGKSGLLSVLSGEFAVLDYFVGRVDGHIRRWLCTLPGFLS